jgi:hypothetical protein
MCSNDPLFEVSAHASADNSRVEGIYLIADKDETAAADRGGGSDESSKAFFRAAFSCLLGNSKGHAEYPVKLLFIIRRAALGIAR